MKSIIKITKYLIIFSFIFFCSNNTFAKEKEYDSDFTLGIDLPDNQINKEVTYLDIPIEKGVSKKVELILTNNGKSNKKIQISATNATTNDNGIIDYNVKEKNYKYDSTLIHPFVSLTGPPQVIDIKSGEQKKISFEIKFPDEEFDGVILGAFVAELIPESDDINKDSVTIVNKFQLVKGVVLHGSELKNTKETITLNKVVPGLINYKPAVTANIQNTKAQILKINKIEAKIYRKNSTIVYKKNILNNIVLAPNSNFNMPIPWEEDKIEPGNYTIKLNIELENDRYDFEKKFEITKKESIDINNSSMTIINKNNNKYIIIFIIVTILLIFVLFFIFFIKNKKKKKKKNLKKRSRKNNTKNV